MVEDKYIGKWVFPETDNPLDFVGRKGEQSVETLAGYIMERLGVDGHDRVLDLCCGNGLVTRNVAPHCREIAGVDFSAILIEQANTISRAGNASYRQGDASQADQLFERHSFDKIYISTAFQYFDEDLGRRVLQNLANLIKPGGRILITDIPDRDRRTIHKVRAVLRLFGSGGGRFHGLGDRYRYVKRQIANRIRKDRGENLIGWWWKRADLARAASEVGLDCDVLDIPKHLPHHYYRFDALLASPSEQA